MRLARAASAEMYYEVVVKYLKNMINLLDLVCDRISLETFLDSSIMRFRDCFYTKKNVTPIPFRKNSIARSKLACPTLSSPSSKSKKSSTNQKRSKSPCSSSSGRVKV